MCFDRSWSWPPRIIVQVNECMPSRIVAQGYRNVPTNLLHHWLQPPSKRNKVIHIPVCIDMASTVIVSVPKPRSSLPQIGQQITSISKIKVPYVSCCENSVISWRREQITKICQSICQESTVVFLSIAFPLASRSLVWLHFNPKRDTTLVVQRLQDIYHLLYLTCWVIITTNNHITISIIKAASESIVYCLKTIWINGSPIIQGINSSNSPRISLLNQTSISSGIEWTNQINKFPCRRWTEKQSQQNNDAKAKIHFLIHRHNIIIQTKSEYDKQALSNRFINNELQELSIVGIASFNMHSVLKDNSFSQTRIGYRDSLLSNQFFYKSGNFSIIYSQYLLKDTDDLSRMMRQSSKLIFNIYCLQFNGNDVIGKLSNLNVQQCRSHFN